MKIDKRKFLKFASNNSKSSRYSITLLTTLTQPFLKIGVLLIQFTFGTQLFDDSSRYYIKSLNIKWHSF